SAVSESSSRFLPWTLSPFSACLSIFSSHMLPARMLQRAGKNLHAQTACGPDSGALVTWRQLLQ
ncbi:hypothetical protein KUCAC02_025212, partial [Chaenocephalus aceratus]